MASASDHDHDDGDASQPHIHRPIPRRAFEPHILRDSPTHDESSENETAGAPLQQSKSSDFLAQLNARLLRTTQSRSDDAPESPIDGSRGLQQNKSFLNMKSALFGIYDDVGASTEAASVVETPWGTGAETPGHVGMGWHGQESGLSMTKAARRAGHSRRASHGHAHAHSHTRRRSTLSRYAVLGAKLVALFTFGIFYGTIVSHLHDTRQLAAVRIRSVDRGSWFYVMAWGVGGVALGSLLPWVEGVWNQRSHRNIETEGRTAKSKASRVPDAAAEEEEEEEEAERIPISEQINDVVRSVAAFIGVAFAIRRLPWQSTLQLTLTLALVNPALWYILDRSKPGLSISLIFTSLLTSLMFLSNPTALPSQSPSTHPTNATFATAFSTAAGGRSEGERFLGVMGYESLAVVTWVGSVLFCSCVCFGSIGRRLAVLEGGR